jgi:molecular chaperone HscB
MSTDLTQNYFELFGLSPGFEVDSESLALSYRELQRAVHPDRFANATEQERRLSVQQAALINEAFRTLKSPLSRARYLLEYHGVVLDDTDTSMDPAFLMEQMELREQLGGVRGSDDPFEALNRVRDAIESRERALVESLYNDFADAGTAALERAQASVRKLQFMQRLLEEAENLEEDLVHEH